MNIPILSLKDGYKTDHRRQYPQDTEFVYSNFTPRGSRNPHINQVVVFGIQYFLKEYLIDKYNNDFFNKPAEEVIPKYKRRLDTYLGKDAVPVDHIYELHKLGYLPLRIKALPEGSLCKMRVPFFTIRNTDPRFFWLTNELETLISLILWMPTTAATIAHEYNKILSDYADKTSDIPELVQWQGHDFSMRGLVGVESCVLVGMGHLLSFSGTDTIPAIEGLEQYYYADAEKELIGGSVYATEHSVMCLGGQETEIETFRRLLKLYEHGIVSVVSDTWDYWKVLTYILPQLKDEIMVRSGPMDKLVIRPDSGDPVKIICGDPDKPSNTPEGKGSIQILWDLFGGTVNSKGYKQLDPHIGLIYGDSITPQRAEQILSILEIQGFASTNVVFGIGSYTYQYNTRDTFGLAMKATWGQRAGVGIEIFKDPKTDSGLKKSAKGLMQVATDGSLVECVDFEAEHEGLLQTVFHNGKLKNEQSLSEIRARLESQRVKGRYA